MAIDFKLPDLGENIESGDIVNVLVKEGDQISADQSVLEIETGKAVVELPCPHAGRVTKVHVKKGSKVKVGDPLLSLENNSAAAAPGKAAPAKPKAEAKSEPKPKPEAAEARQADAAEESTPAEVATIDKKSKPTADRKPAAAEPASSGSTPAARKKTPPAGPSTRRLARELGVDLNEVSGSGAGGRITEEDVKAAVRKSTSVAARPGSAPSARAVPLPDGKDDKDNWGPVRRQSMPKIRKTIALNMARSASVIPHVTNFDDADITELERIRKGGMADYVESHVKLTMMSFVMKAIAQSLRMHPLLNASVDMEREEIIYKDYVNIGVAVDTDRGLVVPVIRDVDRMSIPRIAQALTTVAEKARGAQFSLEDLRGATFTISNLGAVGGTYSTPIINHPDVAILLTGRSRKLPVVIDDKVEIRLMMPLSLSYDHRVVDGAAAARFLNEIINYLKVPGRLLLAP